jgi:ATP adenylyltransferase
MNHKSTATLLKPGSLWPNILQVSQSALQTGALRPISTRGEIVRDGAVDFLVRVASSLARKAVERTLQAQQAHLSRPRVNPFLPYDKRLFVSDISDTHFCLLNKYQVMNNHILLITRQFEPQENLLTLRDFEALWLCLAEKNALAFYNGGKVAGASQPHKHLQLLGLPIVETGPAVPVQPLLDGLPADGSLSIAVAAPFTHRAVRRVFEPGSDPFAMAAFAFRQYRAMLEAVGLNRADQEERCPQAGPYNFLATRDWMLLVPRSREFYESISINALAFAGTFFVKEEAQVETLKNAGPFAALRAVTVAHCR